MNVLVTGGAGFIGSNLVHFLAQQRAEWKITVVDALTYAGNLHSISSLIDQKRINFERADICDQSALAAIFNRQQFDLAFHLAAESHVDRSIESAAAFVRTNVVGTQVLLDAARQNGVKRFLHISTDEVYGSLGPTGRFFESTPLDPTSPYAASKASSDLMVLAAAKTHAFPAIVTRCTNNYGPYQFPEKFIPLFISHALQDKKLPLYGDGMNVRSWIHVDDHSAALLAVAERGRYGEVYNIGAMAEGELPNREVAERILKILGKPDSLIQLVGDRLAHDRRYAVDCNKAKSELGWEPKINFNTGLEQTVRWYQANQPWLEAVQSGEYKRFYETNYGHRGADKASQTKLPQSFGGSR
jgi:dTDP-glucose 4,6-dehydratase